MDALYDNGANRKSLTPPDKRNEWSRLDCQPRVVKIFKSV